MMSTESGKQNESVHSKWIGKQIKVKYSLAKIQPIESFKSAP